MRGFEDENHLLNGDPVLALSELCVCVCVCACLIYRNSIEQKIWRIRIPWIIYFLHWEFYLAHIHFHGSRSLSGATQWTI